MPNDPRQIRLLLGITQEELAGRLRVSKRTVSRWESLETRPHEIYLWRMQRMLELHAEEAEPDGRIQAEI